MSISENKAVFLSYASQDAEAARKICEALRAAGVEVWFDQNELIGGDAWDGKIRKQISECALFVPVISAATQARLEGYFRLEWKLAAQRTQTMAEEKVFLLPVVIDDTRDAEAKVPAEFKAVQWTRLSVGEGTEKFCARVRRLLGAEVAPASSRLPEPNAGKMPALRRTPGLRRTMLLLAGLGVALGFAWWQRDRFGAHKAISAATPAVSRKSIAVLPFVNRSERKEDQFFTDGVHDDLLTQVARVRDIKTISRTSVMVYRETTKNMRQIGQELGVATLLEGGVQRAGSQVRINVQLIDATSDAPLWSETYTRELTAENIFAIQSEIATAVVRELAAVLTPAEQQQLGRPATANLAALEKYFQGKASARRNNTHDLALAQRYFEEAIRLDDHFAPAYAELAGILISQIYHAGRPGREQLTAAEPLIERAIQLDPQLCEAYVSRGWLLSERGDASGARAAFSRAIELKPNSDVALNGLANLLYWSFNEGDAARTLAHRAAELNPEDPNIRLSELTFDWDRLKPAERRSRIEALVRDHPEHAESLGALAFLDFIDRDVIGAFVKWRKALAMDPGSAVIAGDLLEASKDLGMEDWSRLWLERSVASRRSGSVPLSGRIRLLLDQGKLAEADALWSQEWRKQGVDVEMLWRMMMADFKAGRRDAPRARYLQVWPEAFSPGVDVTGSLFGAKDVALALLATGERTQANYLLTSVENAVSEQTTSNSRFLLAKVQLAQGNREGFFRTLRVLVETYGPLDKFLNDPEFAVYREDPQFQQLFAGKIQQQADLLATLRRMDANGELTPIPPLPGTEKL